MSDEMKVLRNTVEFAIGGGSFMVALICLCLSYLASGFWGPVWATVALAAFGFCVLWCFDDFFFNHKRGRKR